MGWRMRTPSWRRRTAIRPQPAFLIGLADGTLIGGCGIATGSGGDPELGYWIGVAHWGRGYATEAARALIDHAFGELGCERLSSRARVSNPASRRVLEKCGFQWTGVALIRIRALKSSAPVDCFRLDRGLWASLRSWGNADRSTGGKAMSAQCLFCRIGQREVEAHIVYEDERLIAFLDRGPIRPGHTQIVPREHFPYFDDAPAELSGRDRDGRAAARARHEADAPGAARGIPVHRRRHRPCARPCGPDP